MSSEIRSRQETKGDAAEYLASAGGAHDQDCDIGHWILGRMELWKVRSGEDWKIENWRANENEVGSHSRPRTTTA